MCERVFLDRNLNQQSLKSFVILGVIILTILFYRWNAYGQQNLEIACVNLGHKVDYIQYIMHEYAVNPEFENLLRKKLLERHFDCVFSFNYFASVSNVCEEFGIPYIAWTVDSPLLELYSKSIYNSCNYIFSFDSKTTQNLVAMGVEKVYDLPLAIYGGYYRNFQVTSEDYSKYGEDISFVGSTYQKKTFYNQLGHFPAHLKGYLDGIVSAQERVSGWNFLEDMLTEELMQEVGKYLHLEVTEEYIGSSAMLFATSFLGAQVTFMERVHLLGRISSKYRMNLYTKDDTAELLPQVQNCGPVDYYTEMPKVFHCSKINLNTTLRNIQTGIPLRVFDVLGAGGFLITNAQADLSQCFVNGEDLVIYYDEDDLMAKIEYYLVHEKERTQIAENGYRKVLENHTFEKRITYMLDKITVL